MRSAVGAAWLASLLLVSTASSQAESITIQPGSGLLQGLIMGLGDEGPGPISESYAPTTNGTLVHDYDPGAWPPYGLIQNQLLNFDLRRLAGASWTSAKLTFKAEDVLVNYGDNPWGLGVGFTIKISGVDHAASVPADFKLPAVGTVRSGVPVISYVDFDGVEHTDPPPLVSVDVTRLLQTVLTRGFSRTAIVFLPESDSDFGPTQVDFAFPPELVVTGTGFAPVPEAASIVQLGISLVGLGCYYTWRVRKPAPRA